MEIRRVQPTRKGINVRLAVYQHAHRLYCCFIVYTGRLPRALPITLRASSWARSRVELELFAWHVIQQERNRRSRDSDNARFHGDRAQTLAVISRVSPEAGPRGSTRCTLYFLACTVKLPLVMALFVCTGLFPRWSAAACCPTLTAPTILDYKPTTACTSGRKTYVRRAITFSQNYSSTRESPKQSRVGESCFPTDWRCSSSKRKKKWILFHVHIL